MIFTLIENFSYVTQAPKFVEIQTNDPESIQNFVNELDELNIYNHLQTATDSSPDVNYHTIQGSGFPVARCPEASQSCFVAGPDGQP